MVWNYTKILEEIFKAKGKLTPDKILKLTKSGVPLYSLIEIIKSFNKVETENKKQYEEDGWISYEKDIPIELIKEITKTVSKGYLSASEKEGIYAKARKYEISDERIDETISLESNIAKSEINKSKKNQQQLIILIGTALFLLISSALLYLFVYAPYKVDKIAPRKYILPNNLKLRGSKLLADGTVINSFPYGTEVKIFEIDSAWAKVKVDKIEGYMADPYKYLVDKLTFIEIDGIYGNKESRDVLASSFLKRALLGYFRQNNLQGVIDEDIQIQLYGKVQQNVVWQVFGFAKEAKFNTVTSGKLLGNEENCGAVIITNLKTNEKKLLIFRFDAKEKGTLIYENNFPGNYDGITVISKNKTIQIYNDQNIRINLKTKSVSMVAGQNNAFSAVPQLIYLFDGYNFKSYRLYQNVIN